MKSYIPLKTALQEDDFIVGYKATLLSHLEKEITIPFSLVITSEVFFEFISFNALGEFIRELIEQPLPPKKQVEAFANLAKRFESATFTPSVLKQLRECFELVSLDTNNLDELSKNNDTNQILSLRRSTNYEDHDLICPGTVFTKNTFEEFLKAIKSVYLSAFSPSSIKHRRKENIKEFSLAIVVSRIPAINVCLESKYDVEKESIQVESYLGFFDTSKTVTRDQFEVGVDFLKIKNSTIQKQTVVSVYDMEANRPSTKKYMTMGSAQSASEPVVLEVARISKKIFAISSIEEFTVEFVADKHNNLFCVDVGLPAKKEETQKTLDVKEDHNKRINNEKEITSNATTNPTTTNDAEYEQEKETAYQENKETRDEEYDKEIFFDTTKEFANSVIVFLKRNKKHPFKEDIDAILKSLEENNSKIILGQALVLCRKIVDSWE